MNTKKIGIFENKEINLYELKSKLLTVKISDFGAAVCSVVLNDKNGKPTDVVLGFLDGASLQKQNQYIGCTIGRYANRIQNATFTMHGKRFPLVANEGKNQLHGGDGFDKKLWAVTSYSDSSLTLSYHSPDGEGGFPGNLAVSVCYTVTEGDLNIAYSAVTDSETPVNLTNHSYFNLAGAGDILSHRVQIHAAHYTPLRADGIPTGEVCTVCNTPFDFTQPHTIGERIDADALAPFGGYDHNYCLNCSDAANAYCEKTGIALSVFTDMPGLQFYTGNGLGGINVPGKAQITYQKHDAFCMETQFYPDTPNNPNFGSCFLKPGAQYSHQTTYRFSVIK